MTNFKVFFLDVILSVILFDERTKEGMDEGLNTLK